MCTFDSTETDEQIVEVDSSSHGVDDGLGLLHDFFQHEMFIAA